MASSGSGSEGGGGGGGAVLHVDDDERKRKRTLANRESARRVRMRKQKKLEELTTEITRLQVGNRKLVEGIAAKEKAFAEVDAANAVLRTQTMELADRLRFLNSILEVAQVSGYSVEIPRIPDTLLQPWQVLCPTQPAIMASANMFLR